MMRTIRSIVSSVVGTTDERHWGQVLLTPGAYGVIEIEDQDGIARQRGVHVLTNLTRLVSREIVSLSDVRETVERVWEESAKSIILLVPVGSVVYLVLKGAGAAYLKRGNTLAPLLAQEGAVSGEVQEGDTVLLASRSFTAALSPDEIMGAFDNLMPPEVSEKLTYLIHTKENGSGGAALILHVAKIASAEEASDQDQDRQPAGIRMTAVFAQLPSILRRITVRRVVSRIRRMSFAGVRSRLSLLRKQRPRFTAALAGVLVLLFIGSVLLGIRRQATQKSNEAAEQTMTEARYYLEEGRALMDLNPVTGRERLRHAKELLEPLTTTLSERSREGRPVHELYREVVDSLTQALRIVRFTPELFFDVGLVKSDARASAFGIVDDTMGIIDTDGQTVYRLDLATKNGQIMAGGSSFSGSTGVAITAENLYVLGGEGIETVRIADKKVLTSPIERDSAWGDVRMIGAYGGNLYVLDTEKSRIWKYIGTDAGFSRMSEYLNPDTFPDLSQATSMAIDGSVWVATADGRVLRFTQGREQTYAIEGVEPSFGTTLAVYTGDTSEYVYIMDSGNTRAVVLDKDGIYLSQYVWEGDFSPRAIAASETLKKLFFLADGKIYSTDLK